MPRFNLSCCVKWCFLILGLSLLIAHFITRQLFQSFELASSSSAPGPEHEEGPSPLPVSIVTFQQDKKIDNVKDWINWHGSIVGLHNVHFINHLSKPSNHSTFLQCCERKGLNVLDFVGNFSAKKHAVSSKIRRVIKSSSFVVPLDGDEFLVLEEDAPNPIGLAKGGKSKQLMDEMKKGPKTVFSAKPDLIRKAFDSLPRTGKKYKLAERINSCAIHGTPTGRVVIDFSTIGSPAICGVFQKTFYMGGPRNGFIRTDPGNHLGFVQHDGSADSHTQYATPLNYYHRTSLGIVHFLHATYEQWATKMKNRASSYGYTLEYCKSVQSAEEKKAIRGGHYCEGIRYIAEGKGHTLYDRLCSGVAKNAINMSGLKDFLMQSTNLPCGEC